MERMNKGGQMDLLNVIFGLIVICGGAIISFGMVNFGSLVATAGLMLELVKLVMQRGL